MSCVFTGVVVVGQNAQTITGVSGSPGCMMCDAVARSTLNARTVAQTLPEPAADCKKSPRLFRTKVITNQDVSAARKLEQSGLVTAE